jgi:repressor LexA
VAAEDGATVEPGDHNGSSVEAGPPLLSVPLLGRIAAGAPILAEENREATFHIDPALFGGRRAANPVFVLRVRGDSMVNAGIFDGDLIFVEKTEEARSGEIVAAMIDGEATVKRFFREGDRLRLQPENNAMSPIVVTAAEGRSASVMGRVIGVFRQV